MDTTSDTVSLPGTDFVLDGGRKFRCHLGDLKLELNSLAAALTHEGRTHADYCRAVADLVGQRHGVAITAGEADDLSDRVELAFADAKKKRREQLAALLTSPTSTTG